MIGTYRAKENTDISAGCAYNKNLVIANILAVQNLYGTSNKIKTSDTIIGRKSNAEDNLRLIKDQDCSVAITSYDTGDNDTLDFSSFGSDQSLKPTSKIISILGGNEKVDDGAVSNTLLEEHGSTVINGGEGDNSLKKISDLNELNCGQASESSIPDEVGAITLKKGGEAAFPAMYIRYQDSQQNLPNII